MKTEQIAMFAGVAPGVVVVEGAVTRIRFESKDGSGFAIVLIGEHCVVGALAGVRVGDQLHVEGRIETHPKFGRQLKAERVMPVEPKGVAGVEAYLCTLPGIGKAMAKKIVAQHGDNSLKALADDPASVKVKGFTAEKRAAASEAAKKKRDEWQTMIWLQDHGLSAAFAKRVWRRWETNAPVIVRANPYRLARDISRIGFDLADKIAREHFGVDVNALIRREAAVLHILETDNKIGSLGGHCFAPRWQLLQATAALLSMSVSFVDEAIVTLAEQRAIVVEGEAVFLARLHACEVRLAQRILDLDAQRDDAPRLPAPGTEAAAAMSRLSDEQRDAVLLTRSAAVVVITGGPGSGKTTSMEAVAALWAEAGRRVVLCAPTGRAAKRLSESTGRPASTIHRLLNLRDDDGEAQSIDADLVIVDEASMCDLSLTTALFDAVPSGASVLLVGDIDQLPSVGPGQVLFDVIASGVVPVARLTRIFRQAEGSEISVAARQVVIGEMPEAGGEFKMVTLLNKQTDDSEQTIGAQAQREVVRWVAHELPALGFTPREIQVLTPMHRGLAGTEELNRALQAAQNPLGPNDVQLSRGPRPGFRVGDPVLQTRNNYDLGERGVMNGDLGIVHAIDAGSEPSLQIDFDERVKVEKEGIADVQLAYAMSVHKSQGGQFPAVVMVVLPEHFMLLRRNLVYTGLTRGKRMVVLICSKKALAMALHTVDTSQRCSRLRDRLAQLRLVGGAS